MPDLYVTHLLLQHFDDLRRAGEARAAVRRALRERREALAQQRGVRAVRAGNGLPVVPVAPVASAAGTGDATAGQAAGGQAASAQAPVGQALADCCAVGA